MEFSPEWDFFFRHNGRCPICNKPMCPQIGCTYYKCPSVIELLARKDTFTKKIQMKKHFEVFTRDLLRSQKKKNLDTVPKKSYIDINENVI